MPAGLPILLAVDDVSSVLEIVIWIVAGIIWFMSQAVAARKKKARQARQRAGASAPAASQGGGDAPSPEELAEIFKRLGADIPGTPRPSPRPAPTPRPAPVARTATTPRPQSRPAHPHAGGRINPEIARRLARARQEADLAARLTPAEPTVPQARIPAGPFHRPAEDARVLQAATQHTDTILPRLYAMSLRLSVLPGVPMPAFERRPDTNRPHRTPLHGRREVREALIAQTFLQPPRAAWR
ncbi:MAG: hypothetical protein KBC66_09540 [Kiritimatiellae bacterium]|jgi:hypothetical protein|nr:hypothetical protein [Kiritimatiellia bacterium]NLD89661.1 hypothetical protein [Lentisphaerota bacterium]HPC19187.1 hypothetical protein [Kiritimatiellia bacterium]HQQ60428.1 hypothetical protein [Kiritimatiellia bacterium]